jgi:hypothetical protein
MPYAYIEATRYENMFDVLTGRVAEITKDLPEIQEILVAVDGEAKPQPAYNYPMLNRRLAVGDNVIMNVTAVKLGLGTGGRHFVIPDYAQHNTEPAAGHIMKLRYTPWQFPVLAAEEEQSPYHESIKNCESLGGIPVVAAPLHSMLPGVILGFRRALPYRPKVAFVMTDGAALPLALSDLVRELKRQELLDLTVTSGQAFGGDLEAVSVPAALLAAREAIQADLIIVSLGPGIVGTGTKYGFSGIEQSWILDLAAHLEGIPVAVPRISGADRRQRHLGLSHHSRTILNLTHQPVLLPFSRLLPESLARNMMDQLRNTGLISRHHWYYTSELAAEPLFNDYGLRVKSMGRTVAEDPAFFQAAVGAGFLAAQAALDEVKTLERVK